MNHSEKPESFEETLLSHAEMCYSVALALTRNPERAQELARSVLTGAWHLRDSVQGSEDLKRRLLSALRRSFVKDYREARAARGETVFAQQS
jgi:DNA-directed RNA polymerase specialized sigma24 family protein